MKLPVDQTRTRRRKDPVEPLTLAIRASNGLRLTQAETRQLAYAYLRNIETDKREYRPHRPGVIIA